MKSDPSLLQAALVGYQAKLSEIQQAMADIRRELGQKSAPAGAAAAAAADKPAKRKMSAAGRRRIAAAQRKRWAEYNRQRAGKE
jgi:hypothetical protein